MSEFLMNNHTDFLDEKLKWNSDETVYLHFALRSEIFENLLQSWSILRKQKKKKRTWVTMRKKSPYTEFFLVHIFQDSDWIWRFKEFSANTGKYGPEKTL